MKHLVLLFIIGAVIAACGEAGQSFPSSVSLKLEGFDLNHGSVLTPTQDYRYSLSVSSVTANNMPELLDVVLSLRGPAEGQTCLLGLHEVRVGEPHRQDFHLEHILELEHCGVPAGTYPVLVSVGAFDGVPGNEPLHFMMADLCMEETGCRSEIEVIAPPADNTLWFSMIDAESHLYRLVHELAAGPATDAHNFESGDLFVAPGERIYLDAELGIRVFAKDHDGFVETVEATKFTYFLSPAGATEASGRIQLPIVNEDGTTSLEATAKVAGDDLGGQELHKLAKLTIDQADEGLFAPDGDWSGMTQFELTVCTDLTVESETSWVFDDRAYRQTCDSAVVGLYMTDDRSASKLSEPGYEASISPWLLCYVANTQLIEHPYESWQHVYGNDWISVYLRSGLGLSADCQRTCNPEPTRHDLFLGIDTELKSDKLGVGYKTLIAAYVKTSAKAGFGNSYSGRLATAGRNFASVSGPYTKKSFTVPLTKSWEDPVACIIREKEDFKFFKTEVSVCSTINTKVGLDVTGSHADDNRYYATTDDTFKFSVQPKFSISNALVVKAAAGVFVTGTLDLYKANLASTAHSDKGDFYSRGGFFKGTSKTMASKVGGDVALRRSTLDGSVKLGIHTWLGDPSVTLINVDGHNLGWKTLYKGESLSVACNRD